MFNLTGLINTDKLLIQIINNCLKNGNKIAEWEKTILENQDSYSEYPEVIDWAYDEEAYVDSILNIYFRKVLLIE